MFNGPKMTNSEGEVPPPPLEVLIKSKWYRATAAVRDNHFGISLDEDQVSSKSRISLPSPLRCSVLPSAHRLKFG